MAIHKFDDAVTLEAVGAITGGQLVAVSGDRKVSTCTAATGAKAVGVAATSAANGDDVLVLMGRVQLLEAATDIAAGALVVAADGGKIAAAAAVTTPTAADVNTTRAILGVALTSVDVSEAADDRIEVRIFR